MKKLFNNSTKSKDIDIQALEKTETQTSSKSKRKALRGFAFGGVALMMATAGVFAFAPLGVSVGQMSISASGEKIEYAPSPLGLDPENDPVIYTTEDGLEIKWGGAASLQGGGKETWSGTFTTYSSGQSNIGSSFTAAETYDHKLTSGNLNGYPYFTMGTYSSKAVNWVIIGRNSANTSSVGGTLPSIANKTGNFSSAKIEYKTLNDWKAKIGNADTYSNFVAGYSPTYKSFFNNTYETTSPAGAAINNNGLLSAVTARNYSASASYTFPPRTNFSSIKTNDSEIPSGYVLCVSECYLGTNKWSSYDNGGNDLFTSAINSRYSTIAGTITAAQKARIKDSKFFGFSYNGSFAVTTYLTTDAVRKAYNIGTTTNGWWWTNQASSRNYRAYAVNTSGALDGNSSESTIGRDDVALGIRPLMLFKIT